jgi:hypothetical protein
VRIPRDPTRWAAGRRAEDEWNLANPGSRTSASGRSTGRCLAQSKSDYNATRGSLTFWPGETRQTITLWIRSDRKREGAETFTVRLSNPAGAVIEDAVGTVTILDATRTR